MKVLNKNKLPLIKISDVIPFQHDLKDLTEANYNKLKKVLEKRGFEYPIYLWKSGDKNYLMDGHGRQRVMLKEGWDLEVPYFEIQAKDEQEAAEKLLEITSQYQTTTQEGLDNYIAKYELNEAEVYEATSFDALRFYGTDIDEPEIDLPSGEKDGFQQMTFILADEQADLVKMAIDKAKVMITGDEINDNTNGNALYHIARIFNERS